MDSKRAADLRPGDVLIEGASRFPVTSEPVAEPDRLGVLVRVSLAHGADHDVRLGGDERVQVEG